MKCLFINPDYPPPLVGGSVVYYYYMHSSFSKDELITLTAHSPGSPEFDVKLPYKIIRKSYIRCSMLAETSLVKAIGLLRQLFAAAQIIFKENVDIIHIGQFYPGAFTGWVLSMISGRPYVLSVMGEELATLHTTGLIRRGLTLMVLKRAAFVLTISRFTEKLLVKHGVKAGKIAVLTPGIDTSKCDINAVKEPGFWNGIKNKEVLLTVGRLMERKGQDMVLRALPLIMKDCPEAYYVIAGAGEDELRLNSIIKELGLHNNAGVFPDLAAEEIAYLYKHCALFVMPNRELENGDTEGFGIVFLEAGWWGKPVIGGIAGGVPDAIKDGETGVLVNGKDHLLIADSVLTLLQNPVLAGKMGQIGAERARLSNWLKKSGELKVIFKCVLKANNF